MGTLYEGRRIDGVCTVFRDGRLLSPERSLQVRSHSPTGFEWGYCGSGPAQLALALLLEEAPPELAEELYQAFKSEIVCLMPIESWTLPAADIRTWIAMRASEREVEEADTPVVAVRIAGEHAAEDLGDLGDVDAEERWIAPGGES